MSVLSISKSFQFVEDARKAWEQRNRRVVVPAVDDRRPHGLSIGSGVRNVLGPSVQVATDILPVVTVPGMPPAEYPKYVLHLTGATLAAAAADHPWLGSEIWSETWEKFACIAVSARVGVWAAVGDVPTSDVHACSAAMRWSASLGKLIVRPVDACPDTELWRFFMQGAPRASAPMLAAAQAVMWVAPVMLLSAATSMHRTVDSYTGGILEGVVKRYLSEAGGVGSYLDLSARKVWDTMRAASTAGYSAERIRSLARDAAYSASAQLRVARDGAALLQQQLEDAMAADTGQAESDGDISDDESVADTEVGSPVASRRTSSTMPPVAEEDESATAAEIPPPLNVTDYQALTDAIRKVKPMTPAVRSMMRMPAAVESEVQF